jgi:CDP-diacylglycerol--glycerol-3-phosphate 3-phosphatidyltransferase
MLAYANMTGYERWATNNQPPATPKQSPSFGRNNVLLDSRLRGNDNFNHRPPTTDQKVNIFSNADKGSVSIGSLLKYGFPMNTPSSISPLDTHSDAKLPGLYRELSILWFTGWGCLVSIFIVLGTVWPWSSATQWLVQGGLLWWLVYYLTARRVFLNKPSPDAELYASLGWANRLTLLRGLLVAMTGGFIFQEQPLDVFMAWIMPSFYSIAAIIDRIDGFVARKTNHQSLLGVRMDMDIDALGLLVAPVLALWYGKIHWSYLLVSVAYYLFHWGLAYRRKHNLPVYELPQNMSRRAVAGFQMGFIAVVLWPFVQPPASIIAGFAFMVPVLLGFIIDWLTVSGRIRLQDEKTHRMFKRLNAISRSFIQPMLRLLNIVLLTLVIIRSGYVMNTEIIMTDILFATAMMICGLLMLAGIAGRVFALTLIILLANHYSSAPLQMIDMLLLFTVTWVMILGTGRFSLWQWDSHWVNRYDGV